MEHTKIRPVDVLNASETKFVDELVKCWNNHDDLLAACEVAVLAMTHEPINPADVVFVGAAIAAAHVAPG